MKNVWLLVLACICMTACRNRQQSAEVTNYDLPQIKDSGELVALFYLLFRLSGRAYGIPV